MFATIRRFAPLCVALIALIAPIGCHDSTAPENAGPLWVLERPVTTNHDTVDTQLPGALVIAVFDSAGKPLRRALVSLDAVRGDSTQVAGTALYAGYPGTSPIQWQTLSETFRLWFTTDSIGQLRVPIRLGGIAGRVGAKLAVVGQEATSTYIVWFDVRPGAPARVALLPHDTAV